MKTPNLREECYNCHNLYGWVLNPCCYRKMDHPSVRGDGKCVGYTPIIKEVSDGEQHSDEVDNGE